MRFGAVIENRFIATVLSVAFCVQNNAVRFGTVHT